MNLPDEDHVMRYVPWTKLRRDGDENVVGFLPQAFELRSDEKSLSVNWLEYFDGDRKRRIEASVKAFRGSIRVGPKSAFGIGNVGRIKEICRTSGAKVRVLHDSEPGNPAHSSIQRLPRGDLALLEALAEDAFADLVRNADIPDKPSDRGAGRTRGAGGVVDEM